MRSTILHVLAGVLSLHLHSALATTLNVTAVTQENNLSVLQCWSLDSPFTDPSTGYTGSQLTTLGALGHNATYVIQPPNTVGGIHNAPRPQWAWMISGLAHIQIHNSTSEAWIIGGRYGLVFAGDTNTTNGHSYTFPSGDDTVILNMPTANGQVPAHQVLHAGQCLPSELDAI